MSNQLGLGGVACPACDGALHKVPNSDDGQRPSASSTDGASCTSSCGHVYHIDCGRNINACVVPSCTNGSFSQNIRKIIFNGRSGEDAEDVMNERINEAIENIQKQKDALAVQKHKRRNVTVKRLRMEEREALEKKALERQQEQLRLGKERHAEQDKLVTQVLKSQCILGYAESLHEGREVQARVTLESQVALDDNPAHIFEQVLALENYYRHEMRSVSPVATPDPCLEKMEKETKLLNRKIADLQEKVDRKRSVEMISISEL